MMTKSPSINSILIIGDDQNSCRMTKSTKQKMPNAN